MQHVVIDGRPYEVDPGGATGPWRAKAGDDEIVLPAWSWDEHRDALHRHLRIEGDRLRLDEEGYAAQLLAHGEIPLERWSELVPLVLWWSAGALEAPTAPSLPDAAGWISLGDQGLRARVRAWSFGERLSVMRACVMAKGEARMVDPIAIVGRLLCGERIELEQTTPDGARSVALEQLDAATAQRVVALLVEKNLPRTEADADAMLDDPATARIVLRLCRALGWTPSQILNAPASEIDAVLALLRQEAPQVAPPPRPRSRRLHDHPDSTVIVFGEEAGS